VPTCSCCYPRAYTGNYHKLFVCTSAPAPAAQGAGPGRFRTLPLKGFAQNQVWCEIVALACELLAWMQLLALTGRLSSVNAERVSSRRLTTRLLR
jgi:hypothetical protein